MRSCSRRDGRRLRCRYPGDEFSGVWDSLPFIERLKPAEPPRVGDPCGARRRQHSDRLRRRGAPPRCPHGHAGLPPHTRGDAGVRARGGTGRARRRGVRVGSPRLSACSATGRVVAVEFRRMRLGPRDRRPAPARSWPCKRVRAAGRHCCEGNRPAPARRVRSLIDGVELEHGRIESTPRPAARGTRGVRRGRRDQRRGHGGRGSARREGRRVCDRRGRSR